MTTVVFEKIKYILVERFVIDSQKIHPEADLQKELGLDSMDAIDLLLAVNEAFAIRMPEQTLDDIHTVGQLVEVVEKYKK